MKKILLSVTALSFLLSFVIMTSNSYAGKYKCFTCSGGGYVCFNGDDTFPKRKKAKDNFGCNVSGTSSCDDYHCKGKFVN